MTSQIILGLTLVVILVLLVLLALRNERQEKILLANLENKIKETSNPIVEAAKKVMEEAVATSSKAKTEDLIVTPKKKRKYKPRNPDKTNKV